jgi:hypothetical protein
LKIVLLLRDFQGKYGIWGMVKYEGGRMKENWEWGMVDGSWFMVNGSWRMNGDSIKDEG